MTEEQGINSGFGGKRRTKGTCNDEKRTMRRR